MFRAARRLARARSGRRPDFSLRVDVRVGSRVPVDGGVVAVAPRIPLSRSLAPHRRGATRGAHVRTPSNGPRSFMRDRCGARSGGPVAHPAHVVLGHALQIILFAIVGGWLGGRFSRRAMKRTGEECAGDGTVCRARPRDRGPELAKRLASVRPEMQGALHVGLHG